MRSPNNLIREVNIASIMSTFAGQAGLYEDGINAAGAELAAPENLTTDAAGNIYIADIGGNRVRMINTSGIISTIAGNGIHGFSGDGGPATAAQLNGPSAVTLDKAGNLYICDQDNQRVRMVSTVGIITTIAGTGTAGFYGDGGPALDAEFHFPTGVVVDTTGNIYICDNNNHRIRKIDASGNINTIAGTGTIGYGGDHAAATNAELSYPADIALDGFGNLYICDGGNSCIRMVDTTGTISTVAGTAIPGFSGDDGLAISAQLYYPYGIKADNAGNIYIADHQNQRVRMVNTNGIITTIAGNGTAGFSGDGGPAIAAMVNGPTGVALDMSGNLFISDQNNERIRKVNLSYLSVPSVNKTGAWNVAVYPNPATTTITISNAANSSISMYDVIGKEVLQENILMAKQTIDIHNLADGVYILQVTNSNGEQQNVKVVKE